jgi:hypothetical protein
MTDCVFCDIIAEGAPASVVYSDGLVLAIMDISPVNPGHVLVMPKDHVARMAEMDEELSMHLFRIAMRVAAAPPGSGVECEGINIFLADGEAAFQEAPPSTCMYSPGSRVMISRLRPTGLRGRRARSWTKWRREFGAPVRPSSVFRIRKLRFSRESYIREA